MGGAADDDAVAESSMSTSMTSVELFLTPASAELVMSPLLGFLRLSYPALPSPLGPLL